MGLFDFLKKALPGKGGEQQSSYLDIIHAVHADLKRNNLNFWYASPEETDVYKNRLIHLPDKEKVAFILKAVDHTSRYFAEHKSHSSDDKDWQLTTIGQNLMRLFLKSKMGLDDEDISAIALQFQQKKYQYHNKHILYWPVNLLVGQIEKQLKTRPATEAIKKSLQTIREELKKECPYHLEKEQLKLLARVETLLFDMDKKGQEVKPAYFPGNDALGEFANEQVKNMDPGQQQTWFRLLAMAQKASGAKPSKKFLDESKTIFKELGTDKFKQQVNCWFEFVATLKEKEEKHTHRYGSEEYTYSTFEFLSGPNQDMLKGFAWMCVHFHDQATLRQLAALAERCFKKILGKGPAAASLGNACLYSLANSKGLDGVGHLSRLKLRIQQSSTQNLIEKYLAEAAAHEGVSTHEIEDLAVDDFGLTDHKRIYEFDEYKAVLEITGIGKTLLNWFKPDGSPQKSVPAFVKEKHAAKLKKARDTAKQIEITLTAQRDRLDRMLKDDRKLSWEKFNEFYFTHGLMSFIAKRIIWTVAQGETIHHLYFDGAQWVNNRGETISLEPGAITAVSLWHPVFSEVTDIQAWREFMIQRKILQPFKQAFREVYLLTDAEVNTRTYSNRMAAHILKQHQFNSLAKIRGWKYSLLGAYDDGRYNEAAQINLPAYNLRAEFWVNEVSADDAFNDTGIWLYIASDQVRFVSTETNEPVELVNIPKIVFSEIMRDVDLFVGVTSVGNDPTWRDSGGIPAYRDYWQSYSFGELNEVSKMRKTILEKLVPRLKIAPVASVQDKFLVVKGKLRTYKIHIGSTNILMEPNDQYLCIVPDRGKKDVTGDVFLPFEGDTGLSVIISKALMLADDDKITDKTITSQINYRK